MRENFIDIRWMTKSDRPKLRGIEEVTKSLAIELFSEEDIIDFLRQKTHIGMVAEAYEGGRKSLVGYLLYRLRDESIKIETMKALPGVPGVRESIIDKLKSKLNPNRRSRLYYAVNEYNLDYQLFLRE
jgi:hypothetical protein